MPRRAFIVFSARRSPPGIEIVTMRSGGGSPLSAAVSTNAARIIARGAGLIAGSPTASARPGAGDRAHRPRRRRNPMPRTRRGRRDFGHHQGAVGNIGVVAGILDDAGARAGLAPLGQCQREFGALPPRGRRIDTGSGKFARQQPGEGGAGGRPWRRRRWSSRGAGRWCPLSRIGRS